MIGVIADVATRNGTKTVTMDTPGQSAGLVLDIPEGWRLVITRAVGVVPVQSGRWLLLPVFEGQLRVQF